MNKKLKTVYRETAFWAGLIGGTAATINVVLDSATGVDQEWRIGFAIIAAVGAYISTAILRRTESFEDEEV